MKRANLLLGLVVAFAAVASTASAHEYTISYQHLATLGFPGVAQDKDVVAVSAKVGIQAMPPFHPFGHPGAQPHGGAPFMVAEKTVPMTRVGDHFFAKASLAATQYPGGAQLGAVKASFTLTFADGSTLTLRDEYLAIARQHNTSSYGDFNAKLAEELKAFNGTTDARTSSCVSLSVYTNGPAY